jgi:hypothetical protein
MGSRRASVTDEARQLAIRVVMAATRRLENYGVVIPPAWRPPRIPRDGFVVVPARGEVLFRLLSADDVRERDFFSKHDKERPCGENEPHVVYCGISMYEHPDQALIKANRYPLAVAAVTLREGEGFMLSKTYGPGHYTVWGNPETLLANARPIVGAVSG